MQADGGLVARPVRNFVKSVFAVGADDDEDVKSVGAVQTVEELGHLLSLLTGVRLEPPASADGEPLRLLSSVVQALSAKKGLTVEQINEILLLYGGKRISRGFFDLFFLSDENGDPRADGRQEISVEDLKQGVARFRAFALLSFGNFRFAFNRLSEPPQLPSRDTREAVREHLGAWAESSATRSERLGSRPEPLLPISPDAGLIDRQETWHLGYLSVEQAHTEFARVHALASKTDIKSLEQAREALQELPVEVRVRVDSKLGREWPQVSAETIERWAEYLTDLRRAAPQLLDQMKRSTDAGVLNTVKYLTWDYLDIYVATSMRERWEFEDTFDSTQEIVGPLAAELGLRYFDPTQSFEASPVDKGLLESLMLKRARCTLYLSQESDTFGKDSELAATLAQGKPVVVFIPRYIDEGLSTLRDRIQRRPLRYFRKRLLEVQADGFLQSEIERVFQQFQRLGVGTCSSPPELLQKAMEISRQLSSGRPFFELLLTVEDEEGFAACGGRDELCGLLAAIEAVFLEKRAEMYLRFHPLALQVHLESGVANGVLVSRSAEEAVALIRAILLNQLPFRIGPVVDPQSRRRVGTALFEALTSNGSKFRVVTDHPLLTNSFWSFYLRNAG
jgi:hypothetical protein